MDKLMKVKIIQLFVTNLTPQGYFVPQSEYFYHFTIFTPN